MSKSIIIQKAGVAQNLSLDVLRVPRFGGGTENYVPADGKDLVNIRVKQNGTYKASDFGAYGIAEVDVRCTGSGGSATSEETSKDVNTALLPAIKEGGSARAFSARRLATPLQGGGVCQWLRKADVELTEKSISIDNTTYKAEADDYYGYSQVTVSGISITTGEDGDGNETVTHTDGTGTETIVVPSSIALEPPPSFLGPYYIGQTILYAGMVVKAYLANGNLWTDIAHPSGIIPISDLTLVSTVDSSIEKNWDEAGSNFDFPPVPNPIPYQEGRFVNSGDYVAGFDSEHYDYTYTFTPAEGKLVRILGVHLSEDDPLLRPIFASDTSGRIGYVKYVRTRRSDGAVVNDETTFYSTNASFTYLDKTVYYKDARSMAIGNRTDDTYEGIPDVLYPMNSASISEVNWTMIYGTVTIGGYKVPVKWNRPGDKKELETGYTITIGDNNFGGGQAGETGAGRND